MPLHDFVSRWWDGDLGAAGQALDAVTAPAEVLYRGAMRARNALYDTGTLEAVRLEVPVISIGNVAVGGTGKTPVTAWLAGMLRAAGSRPAILHGGYARDEPTLHRELNPDIPVYAMKDRVEGGRTAIARGANVLLLDDGFQHRRLMRDLDIVLVAAESWSNAHRALPRGPWREGDDALDRAHWILVTRRTATAAGALQVAAALAAHNRPVSGVHIAATEWQHCERSATAPTHTAMVVAGIAVPADFMENARMAGARIRDSWLFPDHHEYSADDAERILTRAGQSPIVTTAKDWVKLRALLPAERVWVLTQRVIPDADCEPLLERVRAVAHA